jgi:hypothetical protein
LAERYYPVTTRQLREIIILLHPTAKPTRAFAGLLCGRRQPSERQLAEHLLWMLNKIQSHAGKMKAGKRGRWVGYVFGRMEAVGWLSNADSRELARADVELGTE